MLTIKPPSGFFAVSTTPKDDEITPLLNEAGQLGWELVNVVAVALGEPLRAVFKRPR